MEKHVAEVAQYDNLRFAQYVREEKLDKLYRIKRHADDMYHNHGTSPLSDDQYDLLKDTLEERDPGRKVVVGAKMRDGDNRTRLPFWLGSMDKVKMEPDYDGKSTAQVTVLLRKAQKAMGAMASSDQIRNQEDLIEKMQRHLKQLATISKWFNSHKGPYVIEDKLDGVSCLLTYKEGELKLYTRGDGVVGADISYLAPHLTTIPRTFPEDINVRGELVMQKDVFQAAYAGKYANPRNLVAGRVGAKEAKEGLADIDFVAYEIVGDEKMAEPTQQLDRLKQLGFLVVHHELVTSTTPQALAAVFIDRKQNSPYEVDGLIVTNDRPYYRNTSGNPTYAFAFKMHLAITVATVVQVIWGVTRWCKLQPRVEIKPVELLGTTVTFATGKNARFIERNGIGPGAVIRITKGGEVIPNIVGVVRRMRPQLPEPPCEWKWNPTGVELIALNEECGNVCIEILKWFFHDLEFKGVGPSRVTQLYRAGLDNVFKILLADKATIQKAGFGPGQATEIHNSIRSKLAGGLDLSRVLAASGVLGEGIGKKRIQELLSMYPNILEDQKSMEQKDRKKIVLSVPGFADLTATTVSKNLPWAATFAEVLGMITTLKQRKPQAATGPLVGYTVVISGTLSTGGQRYTRQQAKEAIEGAGGKFAERIAKPREGLRQIAVIIGGGTKKETDARKYSIPVYNNAQFFEMLEMGLK